MSTKTLDHMKNRGIQSSQILCLYGQSIFSRRRPHRQTFPICCIFMTIFLLSIFPCTAAVADLAAGDVQGTDSADTVTIDTTDISSDNTLEYNDGSGTYSGTSTSPFSTFITNGVSIINFDALGGNDMISVTSTPSDNITININGGSGDNTISVASGVTLTGDIDGGSGGTNTVTVYGTVNGDVTNADVTMDASAAGAVVQVEGVLNNVGNVILRAGQTGTMNILNTASQTHAISATGTINIDNATNINGSVTNRDSTTQASITVIYAGDGAFLSLGEISVTSGGAGALINTQLELDPPADSPGITVYRGGGGDCTSDGTVSISEGGVGFVQAANLVLGQTGEVSSYIARNLTSLNNVNLFSLGERAELDGSAELGVGNDLLDFTYLERARVRGVIDGGADTDSMTASGFLTTGLEILFQNDNNVEFAFEHRPLDSINIVNFEVFNMNNDSVGSIEAAVYGYELDRIFYDPFQGDPLDDLVVDLNGTILTRAELVLYQVTEGSSDIITFTGNHPISGESLTYVFTPEYIPEPATLGLLGSGSALMLLKRKRK